MGERRGAISLKSLWQTENGKIVNFEQYLSIDIIQYYKTQLSRNSVWRDAKREDLLSLYNELGKHELGT